MTDAQVKSYEWSDKIKVKLIAAYGVGVAAAGVITFFKIKPYFEHKPFIRVFMGTPKSEGAGNKNFNLGLDGSTSFHQVLGSKPGQTARARGGNQTNNYVIERPLFDGLTVTLKAVLMEGILSSSGSTGVQAKLLNGSDLDGSFEASFLTDATLIGSASANFDSKTFNLSFNELITLQGKQYQISGFAFDPKTQTQGVPADYSSGLTSRIAGSILNQAIQVGQEVATSRVLTNTGSSDSIAAMEMNRAMISTSQQATGDLGTEATAGLRNTRPALSLPGGTVFTLKLSAPMHSAGGFR